ncbi:uncharacterized protein VTP21DRAFT_1939 [Calcarisporiella thermophila]|uniref:uncharacterized protein n=1 Tax=Calcarisporiella thermophila TaxID=911321 RepID=UPI003743BDC9
MPAPIEVSFPRTSTDNWYDEFLPTPYEEEDALSTKDYFHPQELAQLEASFCRDFQCCNIQLSDMHDLLQHWEEFHVKFDEDDEQYSVYPDEDEESEDCSAPSSPVLLPRRKAEDEPALSRKRAYSNSNPDFFPIAKRMHPAPGPLGEDDDLMNTLLLVAAAGSTALSDDILLAARSRDELSLLEQHLQQSASRPTAERQRHQCGSCKKVYKTANGLKYHHEHGHCSEVEEDDESKRFRCNIGNCGKRYKNQNGLRYHLHHSHGQTASH